MKSSNNFETDPIKLHPFLINLLCKFDGLCRDRGINYSLAGGTLLAAVRRGAILAWDDDIDVYLLREDFDRFREKYLRYKFEDHYLILQSYDTIPWMRLCDKRVKLRNKNNHMIRYLLIDIVPLDAVTDDNAKNEKVLSKIKTLGKLRGGIGRYFLTGGTTTVRFLSMFMPIMRMLHILNPLNRIIDRMASQDESKETVYVSDRVVFGKFCGFIRKDTFNQPVLLPLNGKEFMCIPDYDEYLHNFYSDYFEIPERGQNHNFSYVLPFEMPYEEDLPKNLGYAEYVTQTALWGMASITSFCIKTPKTMDGWVQ